MKKSLLLSLLLTLALALTAGAQEKKERKARPAGERADRAPIRALVVTGGHAYQEKEFYAMWDGFRGLTYGKCTIPAQADMLKPGLEKDYDVIVMYDMVKVLSPEQQQNFLALLKTGIGLVALHHTIGGSQDWPAYHKLIGGKYIMKPETIDGKECPASTYDHDMDMNVHVEDAQHQITRGLKDFTIHDETYGNVYVDPAVHVLLTCDHPRSTKQIAWTANYEGKPVFYLMLGHDAKAWENPAFLQLLQRGIRWEVREAKAAVSGDSGAKRDRKARKKQ